jgi:hypothetical protein
MYIGADVQYLLLLSDFNKTCISSTEFLKTLKYKISWKSLQWEQSCYMRADRQT